MFTTIICISSSIFCPGGMSKVVFQDAPSPTRGEGALHRLARCVRWKMLDLLPTCPDKSVTHVPGLIPNLPLPSWERAGERGPRDEFPALYTGRRGTIKLPTEICTGSPF